MFAVAADERGEFLRQDERRGLALADGLERLHPLLDDGAFAHRLGGFRAEHGRHRVTLRFENLALLFTLRADDVRLLVTLRLLDGAAAFTLRFENHRAASTLRAGLLLHRLLDVLGRVDLTDFDALDANTPLVGGFVEFAADASR